MTAPLASNDEFLGLMCNLVENRITPDELERLDTLLCDDPMASNAYMDFMLIAKGLRWIGISPAENGVDNPIGRLSMDILPGKGSSDVVPPTASRPGLGGVVFSTSHYLSSGWPVAYLVATAVLAFGLLLGGLIHVSHPTQIALPSSDNAERVGIGLPSPDKQERAGGEGGLDLPAPSIVGRVTGMVDCRWEGSGNRRQGAGNRGQGSGESEDNLPSPFGRGAGGEGGLHFHSVIHLNDRIALRSGLLEITYDTGAKVILQGPATYRVDSAVGGYLALGKLTARLETKSKKLPSPFGRGAGGEGGSQQTTDGNRAQPQSALNLTLSRRPTLRVGARTRGPDPSTQSLISNPSLSPAPCPLFAVRTPTAIVTDLGTEFGVEVSKEGRTISHVFRGSVELRTISVAAGMKPVVRVLRANESAQVEVGDQDRGNGHPAIAIVPSAQPTAFVREIPRQTSKVFDLVDVVAGGNGFSGRRSGGIDPTNGEATTTPPKVREARYVGDRQYHRVPALPFVDGVFIPDGNASRVQVDSAGHLFEDFPKTENLTCAYIWAGGEIPLDNVYKGLTVLNGVDYSQPGHGVLFLHANKGITFDLEAIRKANPGWTPVRFRTVAGNTEANGAAASVDVWVLVDGQIGYRRREINYYSGVLPIDVAINNQTHFLTLAATDSDNTISGDVMIFGDPRLEMTGLKSPVNDTK